MPDGNKTKPINPSKHWCKNFKANSNGRTPNACERCGRVLSWHEGSLPVKVVTMPNPGGA